MASMEMYMEKMVASLSPMDKLGFLIKTDTKGSIFDGVADNNVEAQSIQASDELRNALAFLYAKREELITKLALVLIPSRSSPKTLIDGSVTDKPRKTVTSSNLLKTRKAESNLET